MPKAENTPPIWPVWDTLTPPQGNPWLFFERCIVFGAAVFDPAIESILAVLDEVGGGAMGGQCGLVGVAFVEESLINKELFPVSVDLPSSMSAWPRMGPIVGVRLPAPLGAPSSCRELKGGSPSATPALP